MMEETGQFGVANFKDENSVAVISRSWLSKDDESMCSYPPNGTKSVKKNDQEKPNSREIVAETPC